MKSLSSQTMTPTLEYCLSVVVFVATINKIAVVSCENHWQVTTSVDQRDPNHKLQS